MSRAAVLLWLAGVALPFRLAAQVFEAGATVFNAQHRVLYAGSVADRTGIFIGGRGAASLGPVVVEVAGFTGTLGAAADGSAPEAKVRSTSVAVLVRATPWLQLGGEAEGRRFDSDAGATVWHLYGGAVRTVHSLGGSGLRGFAEVTLFPAATAEPMALKLSPAFRGTVGIDITPPKSVVVLRVGYRFERFDFSTTGPSRLEQFRGVIAGAGIRIGR